MSKKEEAERERERTPRDGGPPPPPKAIEGREIGGASAGYSQVALAPGLFPRARAAGIVSRVGNVGGLPSQY